MFCFKSSCEFNINDKNTNPGILYLGYLSYNESQKYNCNVLTVISINTKQRDSPFYLFNLNIILGLL